MISSFLICEFIRLKLDIYNLYKKDLTLDGEKHKIRVKRSHKLDDKSELFCEINTCDLLPGDIIFLKSNDIVPCDCIILEGQCMVNSDNVTGSSEILLKLPLENQNIPFNYSSNKDSILYHGMKIIKTYTNIKKKRISRTLYIFRRRKNINYLYYFSYFCHFYYSCSNIYFFCYE